MLFLKKGRRIVVLGQVVDPDFEQPFGVRGMPMQAFELPQPPLSVPLTAQLQSANGQCWEATFSRPGLDKNDGQDFKGNSD